MTSKIDGRVLDSYLGKVLGSSSDWSYSAFHCRPLLYEYDFVIEGIGMSICVWGRA